MLNGNIINHYYYTHTYTLYTRPYHLSILLRNIPYQPSRFLNPVLNDIIHDKELEARQSLFDAAFYILTLHLGKGSSENIRILIQLSRILGRILRRPEQRSDSRNNRIYIHSPYSIVFGKNYFISEHFLLVPPMEYQFGSWRIFI